MECSVQNSLMGRDQHTVGLTVKVIACTGRDVTSRCSAPRCATPGTHLSRYTAPVEVWSPFLSILGAMNQRESH